MTKLQSLHLGQILVTRTRPDTPRRRAGFRRFALAGGLMSLLAVAGALYATGTLQPVVARDLGFDVSGSGWTGGTDAAGWLFFADDPAARSQWTHEDGLIVTLFAYPLGDAAGAEIFRRESRDAMLAGGGRLLVEDEQVPASFRGFRLLVENPGEDGEPITAIHYFLFDGGGADVHQVFTAVPSDLTDHAEGLVRDLLERARWVENAPPAR
jgi:hypothetical protein